MKSRSTNRKLKNATENLDKQRLWSDLGRSVEVILGTVVYDNIELIYDCFRNFESYVLVKFRRHNIR